MEKSNKKWTEQEIKLLKENYPEGGPKKCQELIISKNINQIKNKAYSLGIYMNKQAIDQIRANISAKRRNVNENLLINVNSNESAYILGFLWADGYIYVNNKRYDICVEIVEEDYINIRNIFNNVGQWNETARQRKQWKKIHKSSTTNKDLFLYLKEMGYKEKISPEKILKNIPEKFHPAWFHGYFDGDGCYYVNKKQHLRHLIFSGPYNANWNFIENKFKSLNIPYQIQNIETKKGHRYSSIRSTQKHSLIKWEEYILQSGLIGLQRKRDKIKEL